MTGKKAFLLRLDPAVWDGLERLSRAELRSVNAEIEYLLRDALAQRGIRPKPAHKSRPFSRTGMRRPSNPSQPDERSP